MTRSARNWASWSRRRDFRFLVWAANWASTTRSQKSADWLAILRNQAAQRPEDQADHAQDDHRPAQQGLDLVDHAPERLQERQGVDDQEEEEEDRAQPEQPLGGRAGGVDDRGAQAVEEDRRRQRAVQVGEEVDDVEPALDQVAQIVGGQRHGLGRALLAVGDQVADDRQAPDQREVEQAEIAVDGPDERRPHPVDQPFGRHLDQALDHRLDGDLAPVTLVSAASSIAGAGRPSIRHSRSPRTRSASCRRWSRSSRASIAVLRVLQLAPQRQQAMAVARLGLLGLQRLEQDDVAIEQPGHAAHQAIAEPQQDERRLAPAGRSAGPLEEPERRPARAGRIRQNGPDARPGSSAAVSSCSSVDLMKRRTRTAARRPGRSRSGVKKYVIRCGASASLRANSKRNTEQTARSAQAKNSCCRDREARGRGSLEHDFGAISAKSTRIKTSTVFSRIATNRRPKSASIRRANSFSCHSRRTRRAGALDPPHLASQQPGACPGPVVFASRLEQEWLDCSGRCALIAGQGAVRRDGRGQSDAEAGLRCGTQDRARGRHSHARLRATSGDTKRPAVRDRPAPASAA